MKIKLLTSRCGIGWSQSFGELVEVSDREGEALIASQQAECIEADEQENLTRNKQTPQEKKNVKSRSLGRSQN